jgi:hypothetical protein
MGLDAKPPTCVVEVGLALLWREFERRYEDLFEAIEVFGSHGRFCITANRLKCSVESSIRFGVARSMPCPGG